MIKLGGRSLAVAAVVSVLTWVPGNWAFTLTTGLVYSIIFLSITLITGMGGEVSLCQATFAGVGAFIAAQLAVHHGVPILLGAVIGAARGPGGRRPRGPPRAPVARACPWRC